MTDPTADNPGGADVEGRSRRIVKPRDAASLILWRIGPSGPEVLMGQRHAKHRFMPDVMVFPGGRVDPDDHRQPAVSELQPVVRAMLERRATPARARALGIAAARELFEETGLVLGERRGDGVAADLAALHYVCRAVTPGGRPIRFNARFLAAPAEAVHGEIAGSGELEHLGWFTPEQAHRRRVADITGKVLVEFLDWLEMTPSLREARALVVYRGMDNRHLER
ncbi:NUDIX hydrolase [Neoroseomonas lacus]|uniref:Hydrolase n=1 Tax=Neoroseomonas lacus TaxID=287609 RepID=A0A917KHN5_9PROT|nr:NUDIX hydrolase [Neoroseomonas lacus]GGJ13346.1 hydrolase [Neoroseomonas lacus]